MHNGQMEDILSEDLIQEIKAALENKNLPEAIETVKGIITAIENVPLNIAITGESGAGKSTFVNVICGLDDDEEEGAAKTGVVETTMEPTPYSHFLYKNVKFWDLPGIGTPNFKAGDYLEKVNFSQYDFFIIIASERFKESHIQLAQAIRSMNKNFYFIRSKLDVDLESSRKRRKKSYNNENIVQKIRDDCTKSLLDGGVGQPHVFLLSLFDPNKYDFNLMLRTLETELPSHKKHIFLLSLPNITLEVLEKKRKTLNKLNWMWAFISSTAAIMPGGHSNTDAKILQLAIDKHLKIFGLDNRSLNKMANTFGVDVSDLKSVIKSPLVFREINKALIMTLLSKAVVKGLKISEMVLSCIPLFGPLLAGGICFMRTYVMLCNCVKEIAEDAGNIVRKMLEDSI